MPNQRAEKREGPKLRRKGVDNDIKALGERNWKDSQE
jgi:hypothetical protein